MAKHLRTTILSMAGIALFIGLVLFVYRDIVTASDIAWMLGVIVVLVLNVMMLFHEI